MTSRWSSWNEPATCLQVHNRRFPALGLISAPTSLYVGQEFLCTLGGRSCYKEEGCCIRNTATRGLEEFSLTIFSGSGCKSVGGEFWLYMVHVGVRKRSSHTSNYATIQQRHTQNPCWWPPRDVHARFSLKMGPPRAALFTLIFAFVFANGRVFESREGISGVSVFPDGTVYVSGESTLYRLGADLSERRPHLTLGHGARLVGYLPDPPRKRSILCWINSTNGACEVRSLNGDSVAHSTRNMRPNSDHGYGSKQFYMFRGGVTAEQLVGTRIAVSGNDFLVAQPVIESNASADGGSSAMTMVRFNSSAGTEGFAGVVRFTYNKDLSGVYQHVNSFQAIFETKSHFYFMYTVRPSSVNVYQRPYTLVSRVCKADNGQRKPFEKYISGAYVSMVTIPMTEKNQLSTHTVVMSAVFGQPSPDVSSESLLVMSFMQLQMTRPANGRSSIYALDQSSLDANLTSVYEKCSKHSFQHVSYPRSSPLVVAPTSCQNTGVWNKLTQSPKKDSLICSTGRSQDYHFPLEDIPDVLYSSAFPSVGDQLYKSDRFVFTSVLMEVVENVTLLLAGTKDGFLFKLHVTKSKSNKLKAHVFEQQKIDNMSRPLTSLTLSHDRKDVYIVANRSTGSAVFRRPVVYINCSVYSSCESCLKLSAGANVSHPLCGWCTAETRCSRRAECKSAAWERSSPQCPSAVSLTPSQAPVQESTSVTLKARGNIPMATSYFCGWNANVSQKRTVAQRTNTLDGTVFNCHTPVESSLNKVVSVNSQVAIYATGTKAPLVTSGKLTITVYDCAANTRCADCNSSQFSCGWCNYDNHCTHSRSHCKRHNNNTAHWSAAGSIKCPAAKLQKSTLSLPTSLSKSHSFSITEPVQKTTDVSVSYTCRFTSGSFTEEVDGFVNSDRDAVSCRAKTLPGSFGGSAGTQIGHISLVFNGYLIHTNPVVYYDCQTLGRSCRLCVENIGVFSECFFCEGESSCRVSSENCSGRKITTITNCTSSTSVPDPTSSPSFTGYTPPRSIVNTEVSFSGYTPPEAAVNIETLIQIKGNFSSQGGLQKNDCRIMIGNEQCIVHNITADRILCILLPKSGPGTYKFTVTLKSYTFNLKQFVVIGESSNSGHNRDSAAKMLVLAGGSAGGLVLCLVLIAGVWRHRRLKVKEEKCGDSTNSTPSTEKSKRSTWSVGDENTNSGGYEVPVNNHTTASGLNVVYLNEPDGWYERPFDNPRALESSATSEYEVPREFEEC